MVCLYCGGKLSVTNSRIQKRSNQVWRRRRCQQCLAVFTTHEALDAGKALRVRHGNSVEPFVPDRLFTEVLLALQDRKDPYVDAREITATVMGQLLKSEQSPVFEPPQISQYTAKILKRFDKRCYLRYQAEHPSIIS